MATHEKPPLTRSQRASLLRGIYLIVNAGAPDPLVIARAALHAGVRIVQYRAKGGIDAAQLTVLRRITSDASALLIVNDDWQAAVGFDCDGVHLGPGDCGFDDVLAVRSAVGDRLIGLSCGTVSEAQTAARAGADYIGVGPVYSTASKGDAGEPIGTGGLRNVAKTTALPVAAIGGINARHLCEVRATGVVMAAVISAIVLARDPAEASAELVRGWNAA